MSKFKSPLTSTISEAIQFMSENQLDGWLLYDYRGMNPIFWDTVGQIPNVTRPCWLWIPVDSQPRLIVSYVDQNRFEHLGIETTFWVSRTDMISELRSLLTDRKSIAMEYSPFGTLPRVSKVDAGTVELISSLGPKVVSSADLLQYATQRWTAEQLETHLESAEILTQTVKSAFDYIGSNIHSNPTEYEIAEYIRHTFSEKGLYFPDGPVVAANAHAADPHFEPTQENSVGITHGDWVLIDLWGKLAGNADSMSADITWTAYVGTDVPKKNQEVFDIVIGARDAAVDLMKEAHSEGTYLEGREYDNVARKYIQERGYGNYFSHRLGHSLGREVHSNAVNLDGWETDDTRTFMPGLAVTIEPGIYLPEEFGVRSEIDVFYFENGPKVTTEIQRAPYLINV